MTPDDTIALHALFAWLKKHPWVTTQFRYDDMQKCWAVEIVPTSLGGVEYRCEVEPSLAIAVRKVMRSSQ